MILIIELNDLSLQFKILNNPIAKLWLNRMDLRDQYPLDDPNRFYGFSTQEQEENIALSRIQQTVKSINQWNAVIDREINSVHDQDTLNYLHNIFERYHGLLDSHPMHPQYGTIPQDIRQHLANLNVDVHRCESVARGNYPRFVCTWYGLPKTETLPVELMEQYGTLNPKFGSVCLNYVEIGKTLENLTIDNDNYIGDDAFRPFNHYSADFNVQLYAENDTDINDKLKCMENYFNKHVDFFNKKGYNSFLDVRLQPLRFPVAELIETMPQEDLIKEISKRQRITKVKICHNVQS